MITHQNTKQHMLRWTRLAFAICVASVALGCGGSEREVYHVSGRVTFDGEGVPAGFVSFIPDVSTGNDGTQGYAEISNGNFDTANTGKGITGGTYRVMVRGFVMPDTDSPGKMLFREYEQTIELPTVDSRQDIIVPASARDESEELPEVT